MTKWSKVALTRNILLGLFLEGEITSCVLTITQLGSMIYHTLSHAHEYKNVSDNLENEDSHSNAEDVCIF